MFQVDRITLAYPARRGQPAAPILTDVSFEVGRGASLTLIGPSGSGKSTLLRCLNRLEEPTGGSVRFHGRDITSLDPLELRRRAALVLQTPVLFEGTVRDNLRMQPSTARTDLSEARLAHALTEVGLDGGFLDRDGVTLSGGEKQRVTISRALLGDPEALLLDEPTAALDPRQRRRLWETAATAKEVGGAIVLVTQNVEDLHRVADRVAVLLDGEVVFDGSYAEYEESEAAHVLA